MKLLGVVPTGLRNRARAALSALGCAGVALLVGGCNAISTGASGGDQISARLERVPASHLRLDAESLARQHEGDYTLTGIGDSMQPVYGTGTVLVVHPTSFFMLHAGMPVVYRNCRGHAVAHVLVERTAGGWIAKGLNNSEPDDDAVTADNLIGIIRCAFVPARSVVAAGVVDADCGTERGIALLH